MDSIGAEDGIFLEYRGFLRHFVIDTVPRLP